MVKYLPKDECVAVVGRSVHPSTCAEVHERGVHVQRYQTKSLRQDLVMNNRGVVPDVDMLDGYCRYLGIAGSQPEVSFGGRSCAPPR